MMALAVSACGSNEPAEEAPADDGGGSAAEEVKIGVVMSDSGGFFQQFKTGLEASAEAAGFEMAGIYDAADSAKKIDAVKNFANTGYNYIICHVDSPEQLKPVMEEVQAKGVKFIAYDTAIEGADLIVVTDNTEMGKIVGKNAVEWVEATFSEGDTVQAGILGYSSFPFLVERADGIKAALAESKIKIEIVDEQDAGGLNNDGTNVGNTWLTQYPDMNLVVGINDAGAVMLYNSWKAGNKKDQDKVGIFAVDALPDALQAIRAGGMYRGTADNKPADIAQSTIDAITAASEGDGTFDQKEIVFLPGPVNASNISEYPES
jgi:ribose transport system substrate-binding protein